MNSLHLALVELLARFVSPITARSVLTRAFRDHNLDPENLNAVDLKTIAPRLEAGVKLFVDSGVLEEFRARLNVLVGELPARESLTVHIRTESDLADALTATRQLCRSWRVRALIQQRIATIVSELGRNIVSYTPGGTVELIPLEGPPPRVLVRAKDGGSGIANLEEILEGRYRSGTGLGKGLLGSKRLADRFDVRSAHDGTTVEAELEL